MKSIKITRRKSQYFSVSFSEFYDNSFELCITCTVFEDDFEYIYSSFSKEKCIKSILEFVSNYSPSSFIGLDGGKHQAQQNNILDEWAWMKLQWVNLLDRQKIHENQS